MVKARRGTSGVWVVCAALAVLHPAAASAQAQTTQAQTAQAQTAQAQHAHDQVQDQAGHVLQLGIGAMSCRYWLSTAQLEGEGNAWLLGYWTARNVANPGDHEIGSHTDGNGILTRLRKTCRDRPTAQLEDTANALYTRMAHDRRSAR